MSVKEFSLSRASLCRICSYDSPSAAQNAINITNGCQLGGKKLKVQLKRDNKQNKPYCLGGESWKEVENICNMWSTRNLDN